MADHDDHNYYTRSNRESQIPDYDVNLAEPSDNAVLPSFAYQRQSREYSPKRPTATTSYDQNKLDVRSSRALGGSRPAHLDSSPDPHEFYRQYRESFQRRPESVYGQFDISTQPAESPNPAATNRQRYSPVTTRTNGHVTTPVSARWNRSVESRKTPSPMGEQTSARPGHSVPRARGDIQALVNKFNAVRDESPPAPIRVTSRSTSANHSETSASLPMPKSFRSRTSQDARANVSALGTRPTRDSVTGKIGGGATTHIPNKLRKSSQITTSALASQSMTNLSPTTASPSQQPLFGEITQENSNSTGFGFGIPPGRRRGSDGNLRTSSTIFSSDGEPISAAGSQSLSPSAWYTNVTPSLDGINLDQPIPPKKTGHRRSRSDMGIGPLILASHSAIGRPLTILSPPQEMPSPSPNDSSRTPSQPKVPLSARRPSMHSESETSSGYRTPTRSSSTIPLSSRNSRTSMSTTPRSSKPRHSPRYRNPSPPKNSPNVAAFVAESSAPLRSPPLRSSRPRMSVAEASTVASRARTVPHHNDTDAFRAPSKIPNLPPNANMEQRRQLIRRDFTKSWHEKEERQKRQSLYTNNPDDIPIPDVPSPSRPVKTHTPVSETLHSSPENTDAFATPAEKRSPQLGMTIDTSEIGNSMAHKFDLADSPTLGTADLPLVARHGTDYPSTPGSAGTESTSDTSIDHHLRNREIEREIREQITASGLSVPRLDLLSPRSDFDDGESIEIMLGDSPALEERFLPRLTPLRAPVPVTPTSKTKSNSVISPFQHLSNSQSASSSTSTTLPSTHGDVPWSPTSNVPGSSTQDRESENSIESLLDTYQESEPRRLFSQSPGLARAGGWDNSKVTRMYLQSRGQRTPDPSDAPPQPHFQFDEDSDILQPAKIEMPPAQKVPRSRSPRVDNSAEQDVFAEPNTNALNIPNKVFHRASLSHRDDFVNTSPSMLDWMHNHQSASPVDIEVAQSRKKLDDAFLPNIPGGGLGILAMGQEMLSDLPSELPTNDNHISELHSSPPKKLETATEPITINELHGSPSKRAEMLAEGSTPPRKPVPVKSHKSLQTVMSDTKPLPSLSAHKLKKTASVPVNGTGTLDGPTTSSESIAKPNGSVADLPQDDESKRLRRRLNIIKELINTESTYGQDMTVVVDIYKGTCNVVLNSAQDERALFINAPEIAAFSTVFLDSLKSAAKSVYILPKSKRWRSKRDSSATQESGAEDQSSIHGLDLSDDDRDRRTSIGAAFLEHLQQMERVYTEFLKSSEAANAKLKALQEDDKVKVWLDECCAYAKDLTTAWSLDSLLVKPFQRITKYPLLLKELCDVTPENHPDFVKLDTAAREISGVSKRINEAKRRMEMVERVTQAEKTKKKDEGRLNLAKVFERRGDKYKGQIGLQEQFQDKEYNQISDKFGTHFFKLQIVMRDVEMYIDDVQGWVNKFNGITSAMEDYYNVGTTTYPEIESKWRRFRFTMKDMQGTALVDHVAAVRKYVVDPMATLLKLHDGPQKLMERRKKRIADYVKYKTMKDRGEKLDKKTTDNADLFLAVNDTLKDELPKLFEMTSRLVEACLNNFVQLQLQWQSVWKRKMMQAIELSDIPRSFADVVSDFSGDFRYTEAQVLSLGICNGSILADGTSFLPTLSQASTQVGDASRRPSTTTTVATEHSGRIRAASNAPPPMQAQVDPQRVRGFSGTVANVGPSPMLPSPDLGRPTEGFGLGQHLTINSPRANQGLRVRASSTASNRSPNTPEMSSFRNNTQPVQTPSYGRPSTSTGRSYESIPTYNNDPNRLRSETDSRHQSRDASLQQTQTMQQPHPMQTTPLSANYRASGIFSSAMPMSDSPQASSPVNEILGSQDFNVLFLAASVYEFNIDRARREAGYPYLTYVAGEIFDVIAEKGELWLAKNQDDDKNQVGWIWNKHFAKLAS